MSEEGTPTARQGLSVWFMSGSMALVMVIGGALVVNSADKSVEEGNPTATQTVAPGGGHVLAETDDNATDESGIDGVGVAGVLGAKLTDAAGRVPGNQPIRPVSDSREPSRSSAYRMPEQTAPSGVLDATAPAGERKAAPTAPVPGGPASAVPAPVASDADHVDGRIDTLVPSEVDVLRSDTGELVQVGFAIPRVPGDYVFTVPIDGVPFHIHVSVGKDGRVTIPSIDGQAKPYHYDPASGRLTATLAPAELEAAAPSSAADERTETPRVRTESPQAEPGAGTVAQVQGARVADAFRPDEINEPTERKSVERDENVEPEIADATRTASRPARVDERSFERAPSIAQSSTTPFTDAQTKVASQPEPTVTGTVRNQENHVEQAEAWPKSTPTGTKLSTRPRQSLQSRPTNAEPRSTVTMTEAGLGTKVDSRWGGFNAAANGPSAPDRADGP